jgi:S1-C subfamily serine protease
MNPREVQKAKKSVMKVMGVHTAYHWNQPYIDVEEYQAGGTAFFVNPKDFGPAPFYDPRKRYLLTNFHVVDSVASRKVELCYPSKGFNRLSASIIHVVPSLDVAILCIDPSGEHPSWRDGGPVHDFLDNIPNLKLDMTPVKGNSQSVIAIGFPSLSKDVQLCGGHVSGRGLGMIQLNISLNGGNSGGPLMYKNKVIGICTASEADTEAIGLAVPIHQIVRFFRHWGDFDQTLMRMPSWGLNAVILTEDYLKYHGIGGLQGVLVEKPVPRQACDKCGLEKNDIVLGINNSTGRYNIDCDGLVQVDWTEKRVPITNNEFIMSLDPDSIELHVYKHRTKRRVRVKVRPEVIPFETREKWHHWEDIEYTTLGGAVFMDLAMNHLEVDEEDEECFVPPEKCVSISNLIKKSMNMKPIVVCTHIPSQTYLHAQRSLQPFDVIKKVNNTTVKNVKHFDQLIKKLAQNIDSKRYIKLETERTEVYIDLEKIAVQETVLEDKFVEQTFTSNICRKRKRKRVC